MIRKYSKHEDHEIIVTDYATDAQKASIENGKIIVGKNFDYEVTRRIVRCETCSVVLGVGENDIEYRNL